MSNGRTGVWDRFSKRNAQVLKENLDEPRPERELTREILEELMEEGTEAFRNVLEKLFNLAMEMERSEFLEQDRTRGPKSVVIMPMGSRTRRWPPEWDV